jgi:ABC-type transporter Mla MlaB component
MSSDEQQLTEPKRNGYLFFAATPNGKVAVEQFTPIGTGPLTGATGPILLDPQLVGPTGASGPSVFGDLSASASVAIVDGRHFVASTPLTKFLGTLGDLAKKLRVSETVIRSLMRNRKYNKLLLDFASGQLDRSEFKKAARKYAVTSRSVGSAEIIREAQIAVEFSGEQHLDSEELALLLDLDPIAVEKALQDSAQSDPSLEGQARRTRPSVD